MAQLEIHMTYNLILTPSEFNLVVKCLAGRLKESEDKQAFELAEKLTSYKIANIKQKLNELNKLEANVALDRQGQNKTDE